MSQYTHIQISVLYLHIHLHLYLHIHLYLCLYIQRYLYLLIVSSSRLKLTTGSRVEDNILQPSALAGKSVGNPGLVDGDIWLLVVWNSFIFAYLGNVIIPIDELMIFQRGRVQPPTSLHGLTLCQTGNLVKRKTMVFQTLRSTMRKLHGKTDELQWRFASSQTVDVITRGQQQLHHYIGISHRYIVRNGTKRYSKRVLWIKYPQIVLYSNRRIPINQPYLIYQILKGFPLVPCFFNHI